MKLAATRRRSALVETFSPANLIAAWQVERQRLKSSCYGIDRVSGKQFEAERAWRIPSIRERRLIPQFRPCPLLALAKAKPSGGHRIICVPTIEDRIIQFSILNLLKPDLKKKGLLNDISYGLVSNEQRTVQDARNRAAKLRQSGKWVYQTDIQKFFDRIPRDRLASQIRRIVPHKSLHDILIAFSQVEIGDGFSNDWEVISRKAGIVVGQGVRQGMPLSPYFAGMLLRDFDCFLESKQLPVIRYVDDVIGFFQTQQECTRFHTLLRSELNKLGLDIGDIDQPQSKTKISPPDKPATFVGMEMTFRHDGKCLLRVGEKTLRDIEARFAEMADLDKLLQKRITLPVLGARLHAMVRGYRAAYNGASNLDELTFRVRAVAKPIVENVLEEIFGAAMKKLSKKELAFLGVT